MTLLKGLGLALLLRFFAQTLGHFGLPHRCICLRRLRSGILLLSSFNCAKLLRHIRYELVLGFNYLST